MIRKFVLIPRLFCRNDFLCDRHIMQSFTRKGLQFDGWWRYCKAVWHFPSILLFQFCFKGNYSIVECLWENGRNFIWFREKWNVSIPYGEDEITLLNLFCFGNQKVQIVNMILNRGIPDRLLAHSFVGRNALHFAIEHNNDKIVKCLCDESLPALSI